MPVRLISGAETARSGDAPFLRRGHGGWIKRSLVLIDLQDSPGGEREERGQDEEKSGERRNVLQ